MASNTDENNSSDSEEDVGEAVVEKVAKPRKKRRRNGCSKFSRGRTKKTVTDYAKVNHRYLSTNPVLAAEVQKKKAAAEQFNEEKKEDDDGGSPARRNPSRAASQNAPAINDNEWEDVNDIMNREVDASYYEDVARGRLDEDLLVVHPTDRLGRKITTHETRRARRMGIYCLFSTVYNCIPEESGLWDGKKGIAVAIRDRLCLPDTYDTRKIKNIMRLILTHKGKNIKYTGDAEPRKEWQCYLIPPKSYQTQLIADLIEGGFGFSNTTFFVNLYREDNNLPHVGRSTIYETVKRMKPVITKIQKRCQGSFNINSGWCRANYRWSLQLLIMFRKIETQDIPKTFLNDDGTLPKCFNEDHLPHLDARQIDYWDETHKKVRIGSYKTVKGGQQFDYRFFRDMEGGLDDNGELRPRGTEYNMKYEKEARFCTGCAIAMDANGDPRKDEKGNYIGEVLPIFDYSKTTIVTNKDYVRAFREVIQAAKSAGENSEWVVTDRTENKIYEKDPLGKIKNEKGSIMLPKSVRDKLEADGVMTVGDLRDKYQNQPVRWRNFVRNTAGIGEERFIKAINAAKECQPGEPQVVDYRKEANPYAKRYEGEDWKQYVLATKQMKALTNVQDLVTHIVEAGIERRKGTRHEDNWYFYHDALSLMTANETKAWMERKGWLKYWILPMWELNKHIPCCVNPRPIGNNPPANPWDFACNKDHDDMVLRHVAATALLPNDDPRKFSLATPDQCASAYKRVYDYIPSFRIQQDILKTVNYWQMVYENKGMNVVLNANGHRGNEGRAEGFKKRGGVRVKTEKKDLKSCWYHDDAKEAMEEFMNRSKEQFQKTLSKVRQEHRNISLMDDATFDPEQYEVQKDKDDQVKIASVDEDVPSDVDYSSDEE